MQRQVNLCIWIQENSGKNLQLNLNKKKQFNIIFTFEVDSNKTQRKSFLKFITANYVQTTWFQKHGTPNSLPNTKQLSFFHSQVNSTIYQKIKVSKLGYCQKKLMYKLQCPDVDKTIMMSCYKNLLKSLVALYLISPPNLVKIRLRQKSRANA
eukprot:TRINITY_DN26009_c0_g1_i16.p1 TRINITY_DN26009_c0_g1~~TRINITY_DN26009_c0_g1_i16.p1  ORF type:complete len:163 (-),score=2.96 TRINITY_DN26009_c0_g1_i16:174-632(-)